MDEESAASIYLSVIDDLRRRATALQDTVQTLESLKDSGRLLVGTTLGESPKPVVAFFRNGRFAGLTIAEATKKHLAGIKKTATVAAIINALVDGGWKTKGKSVPERVSADLERNPDFVRINGEFGLAAWYPGSKDQHQKSSVPNVLDQDEEEPNLQ